MKPSELDDNMLKNILDFGTPPALETEGTGPGKFEGNANPGLAERIYEKSLEGWNDAETGSVEWHFHVSLLGRFLLFEDTQGFVTLEEFPSDIVAQEAFSGHERAYGDWGDGEA